MCWDLRIYEKGIAGDDYLSEAIAYKQFNCGELIANNKSDSTLRS